MSKGGRYKSVNATCKLYFQAMESIGLSVPCLYRQACTTPKMVVSFQVLNFWTLVPYQGKTLRILHWLSSLAYFISILLRGWGVNFRTKGAGVKTKGVGAIFKCLMQEAYKLDVIVKVIEKSNKNMLKKELLWFTKSLHQQKRGIFPVLRRST